MWVYVWNVGGGQWCGKVLSPLTSSLNSLGGGGVVAQKLFSKYIRGLKIAVPSQAVVTHHITLSSGTQLQLTTDLQSVVAPRM
jgi:hypothetical protein